MIACRASGGPTLRCCASSSVCSRRRHTSSCTSMCASVGEDGAAKLLFRTLLLCHKSTHISSLYTIVCEVSSVVEYIGTLSSNARAPVSWRSQPAGQLPPASVIFALLRHPAILAIQRAPYLPSSLAAQASARNPLLVGICSSHSGVGVPGRSFPLPAQAEDLGGCPTKIEQRPARSISAQSSLPAGLPRVELTATNSQSGLSQHRCLTELALVRVTRGCSNPMPWTSSEWLSLFGLHIDCLKLQILNTAT